MKKIVLGFILLVSAAISTQGAEQHQLLNEDIPDQYEVEKGDTLWDIAVIFLRYPWMWPEIWHANQRIDNPHLIFR
jgi:nucleoid-associated protein YgaU